MKVMVLSSLAYSLVNFRGALLARMVAAGHDVVACAPDEDAETIAALRQMGVRFRETPMDRTGTNIWRDAVTLWRMARAIRDEAPDVVLAYTQKPIVYGGIATRLAGGRARFYAMVSGLGHVYGEERGIARRLLRTVLSRAYRHAIARARRVFVFNGDDEGEMRRVGILHPGAMVVQVPGSGIDTTHFAASAIPAGPPIFLLIARLMHNKGLADFAAAARIVRSQYPQARFQILGSMDANPEAVSRAELDRWTAEGHIEYLGDTRDVRPYLAAASVFVLPTYYREGLPRTILEAMSSGRPIITTDTPGCRETVEEGCNGFLIPPRDPDALAGAMVKFAEDPGLASRMGAASRAMAEERFDVGIVNRMLMTEMGLEGMPPDGAGQPARRALSDHRAIEWPVAAVATLICLPLIALVALVVRVMIGSPVLFIQQRAGLAGKSFAIVKFRTMREAYDVHGRPLPDGERLNRTGRVLRRARLDELPELWNVLRGEMSLIGPRPLLPETIDIMGRDGHRRGAVRPGLTGWAQVNGNSLLTDQAKLSLDLWYIANRSLWLDLRIALRTVMVVLAGEKVHSIHAGSGHARVADRRG